MDEFIVKKLDYRDLGFDDLSKEKLIGYMQAKNSLNRINFSVIGKFETGLKQRESGVLSFNDLEFEVLNSDNKILNSSYGIISDFENFINSNLDNNGFDRRADGVKRFSADVGFDCELLRKNMKSFENRQIGLERVLETNFDASDFNKILDVNLPRLSYIGLNSNFDFDVNNISQSDVELYLAAKSYVSDLNERVVSPFENIFLGFESDVYGFSDLGVRVNNSKYLVTDFAACVSLINNNLRDLSKLDRGKQNYSSLFFNDDLVNPRMYVGSNYLQNFVSSCKENNKSLENNFSVGVEYLVPSSHII